MFKCIECGHNIINKNRTYVANLDNCVIIVKNVPTLVCEHCNEVYYTDEISKKLENLKEEFYMSIKCTIYIQHEDNWYVATDIVSGVASQGKTINESLDNLKEALSLYYEDNKPQSENEQIFVTTMEVAI